MQPDAVIGDAEQDVRPERFRRDADHAAERRIANGVVEQVGQDRQDVAIVAFDRRQRVVGVNVDVMLALFGIFDVAAATLPPADPAR